jgi:phage portal protein BeeE
MGWWGGGIETLLGDEEWGKWSSREIARRCGVADSFVGDLKKSLQLNCSDRTYTTKHGTVATMNTANIGRNVIVENDRGGAGEKAARNED